MEDLANTAQAHAARNRSLKSEVEAAEAARDDAGMDRERASKQCAELNDEATRLRRQIRELKDKIGRLESNQGEHRRRAARAEQEAEAVAARTLKDSERATEAAEELARVEDALRSARAQLEDRRAQVSQVEVAKQVAAKDLAQLEQARHQRLALATTRSQPGGYDSGGYDPSGAGYDRHDAYPTAPPRREPLTSTAFASATDSGELAHTSVADAARRLSSLASQAPPLPASYLGPNPGQQPAPGGPRFDGARGGGEAPGAGVAGVANLSDEVQRLSRELYDQAAAVGGGY